MHVCRERVRRSKERGKNMCVLNACQRKHIHTNTQTHKHTCTHVADLGLLRLGKIRAIDNGGGSGSGRSRYRRVDLAAATCTSNTLSVVNVYAGVCVSISVQWPKNVAAAFGRDCENHVMGVRQGSNTIMHAADRVPLHLGNSYRGRGWRA